MACYNGPNPATEKDKLAMWKWATENAFGLPMDKVGDAINQEFYGGQARPEWIQEILNGTKQLKPLTDAAWRSQAMRRQATKEAQAQLRYATMGPAAKALNAVSALPREIAVAGHGAALGLTHTGDMLLDPKRAGLAFQHAVNVWKTLSPVEAEKIMSTMERDPMFAEAIRSGVGVGPTVHEPGVFGNILGKWGQRAFDMLKVVRFNLWKQMVAESVKPGMSAEDIASIKKEMADPANHTTGYVRANIPGGGNLLFGPKLTGSKIARMVADPANTIKTFAKMATGGEVTAGQKAAAWQNFSGSVRYLGTISAALATNWAINKYVFGTKDKDNTNLHDPTRSDWMAFKAGGMNLSIPGLRTEIGLIGKLLATNPQITSWIHQQNKAEGAENTKPKEAPEIVGNYALNKLAPALQLAKEAITGQDYRGQPMPWLQQKIGKRGKPIGKEPMDWGDFVMSHGPIPFSGASRFIYDQFKARGMSALDANNWIKAATMFGAEAQGLRATEDYSANQQNGKRPRP